MKLDCLVIVDRPAMREALAEIMQGHAGVGRVRFASTAADGRRTVARRRFDLVVAALPLADRDGPPLLSWLAGRRDGPATVVVIPADESALAEKVRAQGTVEIVTYPVGHDLAGLIAHLHTPLAGALAAVAVQRVEQKATIRQAAPRPAPGAPPSASCRSAPAAPAAASRRSAASGTAGAASPPPPRDFWITAIASSTGGPDALGKLLSSLPADYPHPIVVVQHMPADFTPVLAANLDAKTPLHVLQVAAGTVLTAGTVYVAPGSHHLVVRAGDAGPVAELDDSPPECNVRPSANVLFRSLAACTGEKRAVLAVVLTGMGEDGRDGLAVLKRGRCHCLAQDERSCVVYGMPRAVVEAGLADEVLPLERLGERLVALTARREVLL